MSDFIHRLPKLQSGPLSATLAVLVVLILAACRASNDASPALIQTPEPTLAPATATQAAVATASPLPPEDIPSPAPPADTPTAAPTTTESTLGTVAGSLCYPSSETPPMTLFLESTDRNQRGAE